MKTKTKSEITQLFLAALFTALLAVISQISIMTPVSIPLSFQIFAICLCGYMLSLKWASLSIIAYIALGLLGLPIFSGFKGGIGVLFEITGGYIIGFVPLVIICALPISEKQIFKILSGIVGVLICHMIGSIYLSVLSHTNFMSAFIASSLVFLLKDIILSVLAYYLAEKLKKHLKQNNL